MVIRFLVVMSLALLLAAPVRADRPCPPDIDCSGNVNVTDLVAVIVDWGTSGTPADIDGSGTVDVTDLVGVITAWGTCRHEFGPLFDDDEAEQIALEMLGPSGPLQVPPSLYDRVDRDLDLIRAEVPALVGQSHALEWAPNQLIVQVDLGAPGDDYDCLNTYYRVIDEDPLFSNWFVLTFAANINVERLATLYMASSDVLFAEPNGFVGGQNFWTPVNQGGGTWRWDIDDGWQDCFDGCDCHRVYVIETDGPGNVSVISVTEFGQSWCEFGD